ncbi:MAG TPA: hypothetical protein VH208_05915 [Myxococcaceae bacterium]|nr:hypothetical protein [Myxococcaceae bacterium]
MLLAALLAAGCTEKQAPALGSLTPKPLPRLDALDEDGGDRDAVYRVEPAAVYGEPLPPRATTLEVAGSHAKLGAETFDLDQPVQLAKLRTALRQGPVLLSTDADTYLVQVSALFALLDDAKLETWILHPSGQVAFKVTLRDEPAFQQWLDAPNPGNVRIIQRSDGLELSTNLGKLAGADPNGPTVPVRSGVLDVATLRRALGRLKQRFDQAADVCLVPSFGTELSRSAAALSGDYSGAGERIFGELCWVYPRPAKPSGK